MSAPEPFARRAIPSRGSILTWIEQIYARGIRRPGYPADRWTEEFCVDRFRDFGLERVRLEPVPLPYWEPRSWSLHVAGNGAEVDLSCFPLPHSAPTDSLEADLVPFDPTAPDGVRGKLSLYDVPLLRVPPAWIARGGPPPQHIDPAIAERGRRGGRCFDPEATSEGALQVLPFGAEIQSVMEPSIAAGAAGFVGVLRDYPGDSLDYYVPYDAIERPIPGVWIRGSDGARLRSMLERGPLRARLKVDSVREEITSHNVVGELPGADEEQVVIGSHHDGPWSSAVEDGSGIALVLAQASYWASVPRSERPHRLIFLLNAGHMAGGAGCAAYLERHASELERIVLELHLEHTAREFVERDGRVVPSGLPETRWWFTSRVPSLETAVSKAIEAERLGRSLVIPPDALGPHPTTDGGFFHTRGVPLVNFLTAPFYLFDSIDTLDKIHQESLVPVTRAAIRIIQSTAGISATAMRNACA
jgi:hypothetical protein